jgi:hypothetical protein
MSKNPLILSLLKKVEIPQDVNFDGHVRKQTPKNLEADRQKIKRVPYGSRPKMGRY